MMNSYNPILYLVVFFVIILLLVLVFNTKNGVYFTYLKSIKASKKTAVEDILKLLYHNNSLSEKEIINQLTYSHRLIEKCLHKMLSKDLISIETHLVQLTAEGQEYALRIIRAHRLWEKYLSEKTGFHKKEWHHRAEQKEHELSDEELDRISKLLGNPKFDPHGDPIPTKTGKIVEKKGTDLSHMPIHSFGKIIHIEDEPANAYKEILAQKIHLDSQLKIIESNEEIVVFEAEGMQFKLTPLVAKNITVQILDAETILDKNNTRLSNLLVNETATIIGISKESRGENRRRLLDLGFVRGAEVRINLINPLKDPTAFLIKGTSIALRKDQAEKILISKNNSHEYNT
ncbi:MAG: metal-dependent transcriptional regulator [Polaribacter sp.]|nr:metal-dependent transcriptional regulator [Polaribacter sp.]